MSDISDKSFIRDIERESGYQTHLPHVHTCPVCGLLAQCLSPDSVCHGMKALCCIACAPLFKDSACYRDVGEGQECESALESAIDLGWKPVPTAPAPPTVAKTAGKTMPSPKMYTSYTHKKYAHIPIQWDAVDEDNPDEDGPDA